MSAPAPGKMPSPQQYIFEFPKREILTREAFIVAQCNRAAYDIIHRRPHWPVPFLVIYGPSKSGKSHLARLWAQAVDAHKITFADIEPLLAQPDVRQNFRLEADDDFQEFLTNHHWQEALFHLYNHMLTQQKGELLLTALTPPAHWQVPLKDLQSRLNALPAVKLDLPDDALLEKLLIKLCDDRQLTISREVITYLIRRMERSFAAAYELCDRLDRLTLQKRKNITVNTAAECLDAYKG